MSKVPETTQVAAPLKVFLELLKFIDSLQMHKLKTADDKQGNHNDVMLADHSDRLSELLTPLNSIFRELHQVDRIPPMVEKTVKEFLLLSEADLKAEQRLPVGKENLVSDDHLRLVNGCIGRRAVTRCNMPILNSIASLS